MSRRRVESRLDRHDSIYRGLEGKEEIDDGKEKYSWRKKEKKKENAIRLPEVHNRQ